MYFTAEPIAEPTLVTLEQEATVVVRHAGATVDQLPALFDAGYQAIQVSGTPLTDPAFALYTGDPAGVFDLELGFRATGPVPAQAAETSVVASVLPAGRAMALSHLGSYDELPQAWERLADAAARAGLRPTCFCEIYVTDPDAEPAPSALRTDLVLIQPAQA